jgi:hypothetical protein
MILSLRLLKCKINKKINFFKLVNFALKILLKAKIRHLSQRDLHLIDKIDINNNRKNKNKLYNKIIYQTKLN